MKRTGWGESVLQPQATLESNSESDWRYEGWRIAAVSAIGVFVSFSSLLVYTFGVFLKPLAAEFGWSREAVSMAFGIAAMSVAACSPGIGWLLDRIGPRRVIVPALIVFGTAFASLSTLDGALWRLYATFVAIGIVGNGTAQLAYSRAVSTWFDQRRAMALAMLMTGSAVGAIVMPPLASYLIGGLGWRGATMFLGGMVLLVGLPGAAFVVRERPVERLSYHAEGKGVAEGLRSRAFWILVAVLFLSSMGQNGVITHISAALTDRGIPSDKAALTLSAMGVAIVAGRVATGWLLDRYFAPRVSFGLLVLAGLGPVVLANTRTLEGGVLAAVLVGFGMGGEADVTPYLLTKYFGFKSFSTLYGLTWTAYAIAGALGPVLMGRAFDLTGSYTVFLMQLGAMTIVSACLMLLLPKYD